MRRYEFESFDGKKISVLEWADVISPKGVVQISHGMAEHAGRYDLFAKYLNGQGYIVFADDHRAHGSTDGDTPGYCEGDIYNDTLRDMRLLAEEYERKYGLPMYIFGHSYGSFLVQRYIELCGDKFRAAVIGGSNCMNDFITRFGKVFAGAACAFGMGDKPAKFLKKASFDAYDKKFGGESFISSVPSEVERYFADEHCAFICSYNFYKRFFAGVLKAYKRENLAEIPKDLPILLIAGKSDPVGAMGAGVLRLEKLYKDLGLSVKTVLYDGVRHEFLNDTSREQAYKEISGFLAESKR